MKHMTRQQETRDQAIARQARENGVRIVHDARDGRYYASSASTTGRWHYVTAVYCDCAGFATHARCMHHSALLMALGWAEETPEPCPVRHARCAPCRGMGMHPGTVATGRGWTYGQVMCEACHGTGAVPLAGTGDELEYELFGGAA